MPLWTRLPAGILFIMLSLTLGACVNSGSAKKIKAENIIVNNHLQQIFIQSLTHLQQQQYDEAITLLEEFTTKEKRIAAPFVNLGMAYSRRGKTRQAEQNFISALRLDIGHAVANNELGLLYRKTGNFGAARTSYQNALTQHPDYLPARKNLAILCEIYLHDLPCALEHYQAYLSYQPDETIIADWVLELRQRMQTR